MKKILTSLILLTFSITSLIAQQKETYDYSKTNRDMVQRGVQAILMCNGLFTSNRTLEQVYDQELAYLSEFIGKM
jgi:hypothetical protein